MRMQTKVEPLWGFFGLFFSFLTPGSVALEQGSKGRPQVDARTQTAEDLSPDPSPPLARAAPGGR